AASARSHRAAPGRYPGQTPRRNVRLSRSGTLQVLVRLAPGAEHLQKRHIGRRRTDAWSTAPASPLQRSDVAPQAFHSSSHSSSSSSRSEEHTSELQSRENLVCRLLLDKKKNGYLCLAKHPQVITFEIGSSH